MFRRCEKKSHARTEKKTSCDHPTQFSTIFLGEKTNPNQYKPPNIVAIVANINKYRKYKFLSHTRYIYHGIYFKSYWRTEKKKNSCHPSPHSLLSHLIMRKNAQINIKPLVALTLAAWSLSICTRSISRSSFAVGHWAAGITVSLPARKTSSTCTRKKKKKKANEKTNEKKTVRPVLGVGHCIEPFDMYHIKGSLSPSAPCPHPPACFLCFNTGGKLRCTRISIGLNTGEGCTCSNNILTVVKILAVVIYWWR